ncbi:MAG: hypothetical protein ACERKD_13610 [Prolixibacteraceae bacterium]
MMKKIILLIGIVLLLLNSTAKAEEIKVTATLDSSVILIGDQVKLHLEIEYPGDLSVLFPVLSDSVGESVEIVERFPIDTIDLGNNRKSMFQDYIVTSFDSGHHEIPGYYFRFTYNDLSDSLQANPVMLHVFTIPKLDSLMQAMKGPIDIKPPYETPLTLKEVAPWILGILLGAGLIFLIWYAIKRRRENKPIFSFPQKPKEPAHLIALRKLDHLKEDKIWQQGKTKEYYSELSDTLREYIHNRFNINAMEQTSDETIAAFKYRNSLLDETMFNNLVRILKSSDLVKFAKYEPLPDENNLALVDAYFFVNKTKIEVVRPTEDEVQDDEGEEVILK